MSNQNITLGSDKDKYFKTFQIKKREKNKTKIVYAQYWYEMMKLLYCQYQSGILLHAQKSDVNLKTDKDQT